MEEDGETMSVYDQDCVLGCRLLREEKHKIKSITDKVKEWDETHMRDPHAAPSILKDLEAMLGLEGET